MITAVPANRGGPLVPAPPLIAGRGAVASRPAGEPRRIRHAGADRDRIPHQDARAPAPPLNVASAPTPRGPLRNVGRFPAIPTRTARLGSVTNPLI